MSTVVDDAGDAGDARAALDTGDDAVFGHRWNAPGRTLLALHNLSDIARNIARDVFPDDARPAELLADRRYDVLSGDGVGLTLAPYGFRWFLLSPVDDHDGAARGSPPRRERASR